MPPAPRTPSPSSPSPPGGSWVGEDAPRLSDDDVILLSEDAGVGRDRGLAPRLRRPQSRIEEAPPVAVVAEPLPSSGGPLLLQEGGAALTAEGLLMELRRELESHSEALRADVGTQVRSALEDFWASRGGLETAPRRHSNARYHLKSSLTKMSKMSHYSGACTESAWADSETEEEIEGGGEVLEEAGDEVLAEADVRPKRLMRQFVVAELDREAKKEADLWKAWAAVKGQVASTFQGLLGGPAAAAKPSASTCFSKVTPAPTMPSAFGRVHSHDFSECSAADGHHTGDHLKVWASKRTCTFNDTECPAADVHFPSDAQTPVPSDPPKDLGVVPATTAITKGPTRTKTLQKKATMGRLSLEHLRLGIQKVGRGSSFVRATSTEEARQRGRLRQFLYLMVYSAFFEYFFFALILFNAVSVGVQTDYMARNLDSETPWFFQTMEYVFCVFFALEVVLRLYVDRRAYFTAPGWEMNVFDFGLVTMQLFDMGLELITSLQTTVHFTSLRVIRLIRLVRLVRTIRLLRLIGDVRSIVWSVAASIKPLFGALLILFLVVYIVGVYLTEASSAYRQAAEVEADDENAIKLDRYFGSLDRSVLSLFQSFTGGLEWDKLMQPLMDGASPLAGCVFCLFVAFNLLAVLNVVTGLFVETAMRQSKIDKDNYTVNHLRSLFAELDQERNGTITLADFKEHVNSKDMQELFKSIDLDVSEADGVFRLLDFSGTGRLNQDAFLSGCLRLRGPAKALDVMILMRETDQMLQKCLACCRTIKQALVKSRGGRKRAPSPLA